MRVYRRILSAFAFLVLLTWGPTVRANVVDDAWGIATDPFKLGKTADAAKEFAAAIERVMAELKSLEAQTNLDVKARIEQVQKIVDTVKDAVSKNVADVDRIVDNSLKRISSLEAQVNRDAINLLYRGQCIAQVAVTQQLSDAIKTAVDSFNQANPGITILGVKVIGWKADPVKFKDPDVAYRELRSIYFKQLNKIKATDDSYEFVSTYQNLIRVARLARCHYVDQSLALYFDREVNELERLSAPWNQGDFANL